LDYNDAVSNAPYYRSGPKVDSQGEVARLVAVVRNEAKELYKSRETTRIPGARGSTALNYRVK
jgi:hypothetical protein